MYKMRNDALVTRIRNTPLAKEPTLEDVLRHIPGMKQTTDGSLEVNGLGAPTIYLNDKKADVGKISFCAVAQVAVASIAHKTVSFFIFFLVFCFRLQRNSFSGSKSQIIITETLRWQNNLASPYYI